MSLKPSTTGVNLLAASQLFSIKKTQINHIFRLNSNPLDLDSNSAQKYKKDLPNTVNLHSDKYFWSSSNNIASVFLKNI